MSAILILSPLLALSGMLALCLGLERHFKQLFVRTPHRRFLQGLRVVGWLALIASLFTSATVWGWAIGAVGWFGLVALAGIVVAFAMPYLAKRSAANHASITKQPRKITQKSGGTQP